jgi:hypothetical protein
MNHAGARAGHGEGADAGIAEQVERLGAVAEVAAHPGPLRGHVGEESEVAEGGALGAEGDFLPSEVPALARDRAGELPAAAALLVRAGDELAVRVPIRIGRRPHGLRLGADEAVAAVALELAAVSGVDEAVIGPRLADERGELHAALTAGTPMVAVARGLSSMRAPAART